jgi:glucokinase
MGRSTLTNVGPPAAHVNLSNRFARPKRRNVPAIVGTTMFIGLDVGGTYLKAARIDRDGRILDRRHEPIARASIAELLDQLDRAIQGLDAGRTSAVGVGVPGIVEHNGRVRAAPNLPILDGQVIAGELWTRTGRPTFLENDANAAALAEAWLGAGGGTENLLFVSLGTGVGGGVVLGGHVWAGRSGYAGELGHIQVEQDGPACGCGSRGCVETFAGAPAWARLAEEKLAGGRDSALRGMTLDPSVIAQAAREGDSVASEVVDDVARALGIGIAATLLLLNIERVVIGGGVSAAGPVLLDAVVRHVQQRTFPQVFADTQVRLAELGSEAGVIGAARVAMLKAASMARA